MRRTRVKISNEGTLLKSEYLSDVSSELFFPTDAYIFNIFKGTNI